MRTHAPARGRGAGRARWGGSVTGRAAVVATVQGALECGGGVAAVGLGGPVGAAGAAGGGGRLCGHGETPCRSLGSLGHRTVSPGSAEGAGPGERAAAPARDTADRVRNGWPEPRDRAGRPDGRPPRDRAGGRAPGGTGLRASRDCLLGARRHTRHSLVPARRSAPTKLDLRPASVSTVTRTSYYLRRLRPNAPPVSRLRAPCAPAHAGFPLAGAACADRVAQPTPLPRRRTVDPGGRTQSL